MVLEASVRLINLPGYLHMKTRTGSSALAKVATGTGLADRASDAIMNLISAVPSSAETLSLIHI